jgi:hypothetical protein
MLPVSLYCLFLIARLIFSNVYLKLFKAQCITIIGKRMLKLSFLFGYVLFIVYIRRASLYYLVIFIPLFSGKQSNGKLLYK